MSFVPARPHPSSCQSSPVWNFGNFIRYAGKGKAKVTLENFEATPGRAQLRKQTLKFAVLLFVMMRLVMMLRLGSFLRSCMLVRG